MAEPGCQVVATDRDEPMFATASMVRSWVLVEQPGSWGSDAVLESRLPSAVASGLAARSRRHGFRVLLLRRIPSAPRDDERRCFIAYSGRGREWIEEAVVPDSGALLDIDFGLLAVGAPTGVGALRQEPLYLVCTNGRHDPCCARLGRPIARTLPAAVGNAVWECSHVGGDRFAANLVCLPHGLYFGRLAPEDAVRVVERYQGGLLDLEHYRGRAGDPYVVQAAEYFLRTDRQLRGIDAVVPLGQQAERPGVTRVRLAAEGRCFEVVVGVAPSADPRLLTCLATTAAAPPVFSLVDLRAT